ncbi:hypothetical protein GF362_03305 [Candidatus Dojkabacteria bacterium]|nr:hypothetical protein [Candidatus Dojkabacteria bacterium]
MNLTKNQVEKKVNQLCKDLGIIKIEELLAGGVVSDVYSAKLRINKEKDKNIVVKYTKEKIPSKNIFSTLDLKDSFSEIQKVHNLDINIQKCIEINTPKIIRHFADESITVMENFTDSGYKLLQTRILDEEISQDIGIQLGTILAKLRIELKEKGSEFNQIENSYNQFHERFLELKVLLYNSRMDIFNQIEEDFLNSETNFLVWTDGDQKNFAVDEKGEVMIFDLGRSIICDPDFMLANLFGHLGLFYIGGFLDDKFMITNGIKAYLETYRKENHSYIIDEPKFVNYFTASLLHRGMAMRWIDPRIASKVGEDSLKYACMHYGDVIFSKENRVSSIDKALDVLGEITKLAKNGKYKRPKLQK